jgi:hypothetical protein
MPLSIAVSGFGFWEKLVLAVLATWRVAHLLSSEDGPADLLFRLREKLGSTIVGQLMDCFYCLSLWVAVPLSFMFTHQLADGLLTWLALSGGACLLERTTQQRVMIHSLDTEGDVSHGMLRPAEGQLEGQHFAQHGHQQ